jgi:MinD-like ATPase involved in chromosome partitioning or flagellar assembly
MTHDNPETPVARETTELYPFSSGRPEKTGLGASQLPGWEPPETAIPAVHAPDDTVIDVPVMEQLPDAVLPDPGYLEMSAPSPSLPQAPATSAQAYASGKADPPADPAMDPPEHLGQADWAGDGAEGEDVRDVPAGHDSRPWSRAPRSSPVEPTWQAAPYVAPRAPAAAPPLRGPAVPWSEVRAGVDHPDDGYPDDGEPLVRPLGAPVAPAAGIDDDLTAAGFTQFQDDPHVVRETAETLTSELLLPDKRATPDPGWRRTVYRSTGGLIRIGESATTMRRRDLVGRIRTPVAGGHHRVAVLSLKGGVGKTTATVGLGSTLASLRGDRVIAVDGNPDRGTLSDKVRLQTPATIRDLLNERDLVSRYTEVRAFTSQAPSRLEILASDRDPAVSVAFSADDYRAVADVLEHYYSICITDCGTGLLHSAMAGILELADQIVLVSSPSVDGARSASATLDWLEAHGYVDLVRGGVVALSAIRRKTRSAVDVDRLQQHFAGRCRAVVRIPFDSHLEEGAEVELELLSADTADAYLELAALVADGFG